MTSGLIVGYGKRPAPPAICAFPERAHPDSVPRCEPALAHMDILATITVINDIARPIRLLTREEIVVIHWEWYRSLTSAGPQQT